MPRTREVEDDQILEFILECEDPFVTAKEVAEATGVSRTAANDHLLELLERGFLERKKTGSGYGWWVTRNP